VGSPTAFNQLPKIEINSSLKQAPYKYTSDKNTPSRFTLTVKHETAKDRVNNNHAE